MIGSPRQPEKNEPYRPPQINLLREVKVDSPVHRLWAGTKLVAVAALSLTLSFFPTWEALGVMVAVLVATTLLAKIPAGALPRPPKWFFLVILITGALASSAGGKPHVKVLGSQLGLGGIDAYSRFVLVGVVLLLAAALVGWTTSLAEIAPAVSRLLRPLRLVRAPIDEWAVTVAVCVRSLPLLTSEMRTLIAARRLRPMPERPNRTEIERWLDEIVDIMVAALAVSVRRAGELAEAITARGGTGMIAAHPTKPKRADAVAMLLTAAACVAAALLPT